MDLSSVINSVLGNQSTTNAIAEKTGLSQDQVNQAIAAGLPMIVAGMAKNAQSSDGANSLNSALDQHTDSPVVTDLSAATTDLAQADGGNILSHVFGSGTDSISGAIAEKIGADPKSVQSALAILAPIAIGYVAKHRNDKNLDAGGVADSLQKTQLPSGNPITSMLEDMLGSVLGGKKA